MGAAANTSTHKAFTNKVKIPIPSIGYGLGPVSFSRKNSMNSGHSNDLAITRRSVTFFFICNMAAWWMLLAITSIFTWLHWYQFCALPFDWLVPSWVLILCNIQWIYLVYLDYIIDAYDPFVISFLFVSYYCFPFLFRSWLLCKAGYYPSPTIPSFIDAKDVSEHHLCYGCVASENLAVARITQWETMLVGRLW